jgi:hypothetical protein
MSLFTTTAVPEGAAPDPTKHVNYTYGMVLGTADFIQEFAYHDERDHWMARDLIGYGTVSGLRVSVDLDGAKGPRVVVDAGCAVTPRGELVRVALAQCAHLNEWLGGSDQLALLQARGTPAASNTDRIDVYVTLCYRSCPTDNVPIPGEPCRTADEMMAPSRTMDDFKLELRWAAPDQRDEAAVRDFVDWLERIPVVDIGASTPLDTFLLEIRKAAFVLGSPPPSPPDFMYGTPPALLQIARHDVCRYLRAAYRVWVTELRPGWGASWWGAAPRCSDAQIADRPQPENCLLIARLDVPITRTSPGGSKWQVIDGTPPPVGIDEDLRPILVPLRALQEWLWCGGGFGAGGGGGFVAGGLVTVGAPAIGAFNLMAATTGTASEVKVTLAPFPTAAGFDYVVTATPVAGALTNPNVQFVSFTADGFLLRVTDGSAAVPAAALAGLPLMIQVSQYSK